MDVITATLTPIVGGLSDVSQTGDAADVAALAALAVTWGVLISLIITIADMRSPLPTWKKAAWALGLCFAPFVLYVIVDALTVGVHSVVVSVSQAVERGLEAAGGTFMGHSGQNLAQRQQAGTAITSEDVLAATTVSAPSSGGIAPSSTVSGPSTTDNEDTTGG